jgi:hypothetical protein
MLQLLDHGIQLVDTESLLKHAHLLHKVNL